MTHKVWITRTRPAADGSANAWRAAGFAPLVEPLLEIRSVPHAAVSKDTLLIFTSKNGVDHVDCNGQRAICVGDATAVHAREAGFKEVVSVDGTSEDITRWIQENMEKSQPVTHVSGWHVRGSIVEDLLADGYKASREKVYRSVPRPLWPHSPTSYVALYSPLAARVFADLAKAGPISDLSAICISKATADELKALQLKSIHVAARPREDELIVTAKLA